MPARIANYHYLLPSLPPNGKIPRMAPALKIAPSILAADFAHLGEQIAAVEQAGVEQLHIDVMDGHFVPNISLGPVVVEAIRRVTRLPLDVHLMIAEPEKYLMAFADAGANTLTVHVEACPHLHRVLQRIRDLGLQAGVAVNPGTPISAIGEVIELLDVLLVMSVNPGYGGQQFIAQTPGKLSHARAMLDAQNPRADLSVDGGIGSATAAQVVQAGANVLVAGSSIFRAGDGAAAAISALRAAAMRG